MSRRVAAECHTCDLYHEEPGSGMGRSRLAAWLTHHQGHEVERTET